MSEPTVSFSLPPPPPPLLVLSSLLPQPAANAAMARTAKAASKVERGLFLIDASFRSEIATGIALPRGERNYSPPGPRARPVPPLPSLAILFEVRESNFGRSTTQPALRGTLRQY